MCGNDEWSDHSKPPATPPREPGSENEKSVRRMRANYAYFRKHGLKPWCAMRYAPTLRWRSLTA